MTFDKEKWSLIIDTLENLDKRVCRLEDNIDNMDNYIDYTMLRIDFTRTVETIKHLRRIEDNDERKR